MSRLDELIDALCDGTADAAAVEELDRLLKGDVEAQRHYLRRIDLHHSLLWMSAGEATRSALAALRPRRAFPWRTAAAAAVLLAAGTLWILSRPVSTSAARPVAVLMEAREVVWEGVAPAEGAALPAGCVSLRSGRARLAFYGGARALLEGPAVLDLRAADAAALIAGRVTVAAEGAEFRLAGPGLDVSSRGAEFGLRVDATGATLSVFEGEASAVAALGIPLTRRLVRDESLQLGRDGTLTADLLGAAPAFARFEERRDPRVPAVANPSFEYPRVGPDGPLAAAGWILQAHPIANAENMDVQAAAGTLEAGKAPDGRQWGYLTARTFPDGRRFHTSMHQAVAVLAAGASYTLEVSLGEARATAGLFAGTLEGGPSEPLVAWPLKEPGRHSLRYDCPADSAQDGRALFVVLTAVPAPKPGRVRALVDDVRLTAVLPRETR